MKNNPLNISGSKPNLNKYINFPNWKRKISVKRNIFNSLNRGSSGMCNLKTVFRTVSDWSVVKWSILIGGEEISRD